MELTQAFAGITPAFLCWTSLIVTVLGLIVAGYYTNITAFSSRRRDGTRKPTGGSGVRDNPWI